MAERSLAATIGRRRGPAALTIGYLAVFIAAAPWLGWRRVGPYVLVVVVVGLLVANRDRRHGVPAPLLMAVSLLGFLHCAGGLMPSPDPGAPILYETWVVDGLVKFDQAVHLFGSALAAAGGWYMSTGRPPRRRMARAAAIGLLIGLVNEVIESGLDRRFATHVGALDNALWDMAFNITGVMLALLLVDVIGRRERNPPRSVPLPRTLGA